MPENKSTSNNVDQDKLEVLIELVSYRYLDLFDELGIELSKNGKFFIGTCPIHGGDNPTAFNLYADGHSVKGFWKCRTKGCEKIFKKTLVGFIRGVLSNTKLGWAEPDDVKKMYSFKQTIDWMCKFVGQDFNKLTVNTEEVKKKKFINQINSIVKSTPSGVKGGISREQIVASLEIPATYYVNRGFSKEILTKYDVGLCKNSAKEMYNRVVVPIYDNDKKTMVACTGRSIHPTCTKCGLYHSGNCPEGNGKYVAYSKWRNNSNSNVSSYLYNYWNAKDFIKRSGVVILVEGPPDIWRLEELGVHNAVALFGVDMSEEQQILLEMSGALSVVILMDMDKPGRIAVEDIKSKLRSFRTVAPELSVKDAGELTLDKYEAEVKPHVQKLERQYTL